MDIPNAAPPGACEHCGIDNKEIELLIGAVLGQMSQLASRVRSSVDNRTHMSTISGAERR